MYGSGRPTGTRRGAFAMLDGSMSIASALGAHLRDRRWVVIAGVCGVAAGFAVILYPIAATVVLVVLIGFWALLHGIFELAAAVELHTRSQLEWWLALDGILSVFFGLLLLWRPEQGIVIVALILGIFALVHGTLLLIFASRLSNLRTSPARA